MEASKIRKEIVILSLLILALISSGCIIQKPYVCPTGEKVPASSLCPTEKTTEETVTEETTTTQTTTQTNAPSTTEQPQTTETPQTTTEPTTTPPPTTLPPIKEITPNDMETVITKALNALDEGDWDTVEQLYDNKEHAEHSILDFKAKIGENGELVQLKEFNIQNIEGPEQTKMADGVIRTRYTVLLGGTAEYTSNINPEFKETLTHFENCYISDHDETIKVSGECYKVITQNELIGRG